MESYCTTNEQVTEKNIMLEQAKMALLHVLRVYIQMAGKEETIKIDALSWEDALQACIDEGFADESKPPTRLYDLLEALFTKHAGVPLSDCSLGSDTQSMADLYDHLIKGDDHLIEGDDHRVDARLCNLEGMAAIMLSLQHKAAGMPVVYWPHFVIDNSASMAKTTVKACQKGAADLVEKLNCPECDIHFFSHEVESHLNLKDTRDPWDLSKGSTPADKVRALPIPPQGSTNISGAINAAVQVVEASEAETPGAVHHLIFLLTDGEHNAGPVPEDCLPSFHERIKHTNAKLSVIFLSVTDNSRVDQGMLIAELASVRLPGVDDVYFCKNADAVSDIFTELSNHMSGVTKNITISVQLGEEAPPFNVSVGENEPYICLLDKHDVDLAHTGVVVVDGNPYYFEKMKNFVIENEEFFSAIEREISSIAKSKVAGTNVDDLTKRLLEMLKQFAKHLEQRVAAKGAVAEVMQSKEYATMSPKDRHRLLKKYLGKDEAKLEMGATERLAQLQNRVKIVANLKLQGSQLQAEFLKGANRSYADKAHLRAAKHGTVGGGALATKAMEDLRTRAPEIRFALRRALLAHAHFIGEEKVGDYWTPRKPTVAAEGFSVRPAGGECLPTLADGTEKKRMLSALMKKGKGLSVETLSRPEGAFVEGELADAIAAHFGMPESWLSVSDSFQQLLEALEELETLPSTELVELEELDLIVMFGMHGVPMIIKTSDAAQMDPWQIMIERMLCAPVDTPSMMLALKMGSKIKAPEGVSPNAILPLVDPFCPQASLLMYRSIAMREIFASATVAEDLFMPNSQQIPALHAHCLLEAIRSAVGPEASRSHLSLALHIVYSFRYWAGKGLCEGGALSLLLKHWHNWGGLSEKEPEVDVCHPLKVLMALCTIGSVKVTPVMAITYFNEVLARKARQIIRVASDAHDDEAHRRAANFLGVDLSSAPKVHEDIEEEEPSKEVVRENCDGYFNPNASAKKWVTKVLDPHRYLLHFGIVLSGVVEELGGWDAFNTSMEKGEVEEIVVKLVSHGVHNVPLLRDMIELNAVKNPDRQEEIVAGCMAAQAFINYTSGGRYPVDFINHTSGGRYPVETLDDVRDRSTGEEMAKDLLMREYERAYIEKMQRWHALSGDLVERKARRASPDQFDALIEEHAHTLTKQAFWSLANVAQSRGQIFMDMFMKKCNWSSWPLSLKSVSCD